MSLGIINKNVRLDTLIRFVFNFDIVSITQATINNHKYEAESRMELSRIKTHVGIDHVNLWREYDYLSRKQQEHTPPNILKEG